MQKHTYFDLLLHDDAELSAIVNAGIIERVDIHGWPLSCVQKLLLADGRKYVYKAQASPTFEPDFYSDGISPMLVHSQTIYRDDTNVCLLLDWFEGVPFGAFGLSGDKALKAGLRLLGGISDIKGIKGVFKDISSRDKWHALVEDTRDILLTLIETGRFTVVSKGMIDDMLDWATDRIVLDLYDGPVGLAHGDLKGDNVLIAAGDRSTLDNFRIIDWQRPLIAPTAIDLATLMESIGEDAVGLVGLGAVRMKDFLLIRWFAESAVQWLPSAAGMFDKLIAKLIAGHSEPFSILV